MQITVEIKTVFGNEVIYPVDDAAKQFAAIACTKTLTRQVIEQIKKLGYTVVVATPLPATL